MFLSSKMLRRLFMLTHSLRDDIIGASWILSQSAPHAWTSCSKTHCLKFGHSQNEQLAHKITIFRKQFGTHNNLNQPKSERDRDIILTDENPDVFGTSKSKMMTVEEEEGDEGDKLEEEHVQEHPRRKLSMKQYANMIKELLVQRKVAEAIDVLETKMLKEDRAKPSNYIYNILITECGHLGYTKKAFQLYNKMKERRLKVTGATYTALFNACANSPWTSDGLKRARHLRNLMIEKAHEPNSTNYHAMIKAFGRCGDLTTAFTLVDEMLERKHRLTDETYNFLLQSCISDKEAGFRHALLVWRKMLKMHVTPNIYTYNLLLRSVRDCGLGDPVVAEDLFQTLDLENSQELLRGGENVDSIPVVSSEQHMLQTRNVENNIASEDGVHSIQCRPNLLAPKPNFGNIISIREVTKPEERLMLIGGCSGFLQQMARDNVKPNVKTFTELLEVIPPTLAAEKMLLIAMEKAGVKPDIDFYNILIKKRSMRCDYESAREVLRMVQRQKLHPDIVTFGVLALGCRTQEEAYNLANDMKIAGFRMNVEILGAMVKQACFHWNFKYVMVVLDIMKEEEVRPSATLMHILENFHKKCLKSIKYKNGPLPNDITRSTLKKGFQTFSAYYDQWLKDIEPEKIRHPWEQFRKTKSASS